MFRQAPERSAPVRSAAARWARCRGSFLIRRAPIACRLPPGAPLWLVPVLGFRIQSPTVIASRAMCDRVTSRKFLLHVAGHPSSSMTTSAAMRTLPRCCSTVLATASAPSFPGPGWLSEAARRAVPSMVCPSSLAQRDGGFNGRTPVTASEGAVTDRAISVNEDRGGKPSTSGSAATSDIQTTLSAPVIAASNGAMTSRSAARAAEAARVAPVSLAPFTERGRAPRGAEFLSRFTGSSSQPHMHSSGSPPPMKPHSVLPPSSSGPGAYPVHEVSRPD